MNFRVVLKAAITALIIGLFIYLIDVESVGRTLVRTDLALLTAAAGIRLFMLWLTGIRWWSILRALRVKVPLGFASLAMCEALTVNLILPGRVGGDVLRAWRAGKRTGSFRKPIFSVLLDRALTLGIMILGACVLILLYPDTLLIEEAAVVALAIVLATLLGAGLMMYLQLRLLRIWPFYLRSRMLREIRKALVNFLRIFLRPAPALEALSISVLVVVGNGIILWLCFLALGLEPATPPVLLLAITLSALASALPFSIAGIGLREGSMVGTMIFLGITSTNALATSLLWTVIVFVEAVPGLFVFAFRPIDRSEIPVSDPDQAPTTVSRKAP